MEKKTNNYKAANSLQQFKDKYVAPLNSQIVSAKAIMDDSARIWKDGQKERARDKLNVLEAKNIDFHTMYNDMYELISQHEALTYEISNMYAAWYNKVSNKGKQPQEMMESQAEALLDIFKKMYDVLQPLKLDIKAPKK